MPQRHAIRSCTVPVLLLALPACWEESSATQALPDTATSVSDDEIFAAAGFTRSGGHWAKCGDPGTISYQSGEIADRGDFNGDGQPDAVVVEGGTYCFGMTGMGYTLVSRQPGGQWRIMDERPGILEFLDTHGTDGWPDIEVGGPGFCFPVIDWNGSSYETVRWEYEGEACQRPR